eukprot:5990935-Prymnesium_polylepis.1
MGEPCNTQTHPYPPLGPCGALPVNFDETICSMNGVKPYAAGALRDRIIHQRHTAFALPRHRKTRDSPNPHADPPRAPSRESTCAVNADTPNPHALSMQTRAAFQTGRPASTHDSYKPRRLPLAPPGWRPTFGENVAGRTRENSELQNPRCRHLEGWQAPGQWRSSR